MYGLIDREMDGGRAGLKADAEKTREAPEKLQSQREGDREKGKAQGSPAAASVHRRRIPRLSCLYSLHAAALITPPSLKLLPDFRLMH